MPDYNAFTGGVAPGGLRSQNDIRILVCYLLQSVPAPLSPEDITDILQEKALANYFEIQDAVSSLLRLGNIAQTSEGLLCLLDSGKQIAQQLDTSLPLSVRDKALEGAMKLLTRARNEREHKVEIAETADGCRVVCHISGGAHELMSIDLYVPDRLQAELVKEHFHQDPGKVYELLLGALTGDRQMVQQYFDS